jgi:hypothetical protein
MPTEVLTFKRDRICRREVYFGWDIDGSLD